MRLIVGGKGQGKRAYALTACPSGGVADGENCDAEDLTSCRIFDNLHLWVRREMEEGRDPWPTLEQVLEENPDMIILCDEIGCGIVPMDPSEREWREKTGRICCALAGRAQRVERVICGCVQVIKGDKE
ncbi:bifunctional adenosylcobinamide kinase/adenosylcobinamide-phosphate guanylyltransferase [Zongyangia hominis]|uniref:Bifunctional adenosylcobinamide kinase/adenosylcobinamide-phosphate guanylyltransferase n=1 Tax=Zongyangia hominis TaxID=2763677 RepID=A0A926E7K2_9FIRM|nr:bifunctional adenosylcobinamide kinase/adenosylcobinamide-phosphate guanylyltransferase [Zongyangia hominis]MBC8569300.1 bifunctional adenosylcobinamide kinase/adenosylcobinamide-phosphate guanylyltransferase [Zongyangia hominis]